MTDFAYSLSSDKLPPLPDDMSAQSLPPPAFSPQQQFGMNGGARPVSGIPRFYVEAVKKSDGTYENVEMVEIITPGDPKATPVRKVSEGIRAKYRDYYEFWKRNQTMAPMGTPLESWPEMTAAQVHALRGNNIHTVEQLAEIADSNLGNIPFGKTIRNKAQEWLKLKDKSDAISQATAQTAAMQDGMRMMESRFAEKEAEMKAENASIKAQLDAVLARLTAPETLAAPSGQTDTVLGIGGQPAPPGAPTVKRGPGRPKAEVV